MSAAPVLRTPGPSLAAAACAAVAMPALIAFNVPPSATFFNQAAAFVGWGLFLLLATAALSRVKLPGAEACPRSRLPWHCSSWRLPTSTYWAALPAPLAWSSAGTLLATALAFVVAVAAVSEGRGGAAFRALSIGLVVAGLASAVIGVLQVYLPRVDRRQLDRALVHPRPRRRQPAPAEPPQQPAALGPRRGGLAGRGAQPARRLAAPAAALMMFVVVLSGVADRGSGNVDACRLGPAGPAVVAPRPDGCWCWRRLVYAVMWAGATGWAAPCQHGRSAAEARFSAKGDISSSRFAIWSNTLALIRAHPWLGVGFGEFNFAWTLTPFPDRPVAFFDHTHNLPLQFAVELGVPLALLVLGSARLGTGLRRPRRLSPRAGAARRAVRRSSAAALVMVIMVGGAQHARVPALVCVLPAADGVRLRPVPRQADAGRVDPPPSEGLQRPPDASARHRLDAADPRRHAGGLRLPACRARSSRHRRAPRRWPNASPTGSAPGSSRHHADYAAATTAEHPSATRCCISSARRTTCSTPA